MESIIEQKSDMLARFGGEEFIALLPGKDVDSAAKFGEKLRQAVESLKLENVESEVCDCLSPPLSGINRFVRNA